MFEKAHPSSLAAPARASARPDGGRPLRRAGDALRAVEWSELTARLNAARDLRLLLRYESQAPIESTTASFLDAAASYFALLDNDEERRINLDALEQSKPLDGMVPANDSPDQTAYAVGNDRALREKHND